MRIGCSSASQTPLHAGHLRNMLTATEMGAVIAPPVPAFYNRPASIQDIVDHTIGRLSTCSTSMPTCWNDGADTLHRGSG